MQPLPNAERRWERSNELASFAPAEVVKRIGSRAGPLELLAGGLANWNVRVGTSQVLRIYHRDVSSLPVEVELLSRSWGALRTPVVEQVGEDFLLLEYVEHEQLPDNACSGAQVGEALAEIHRQSFPVHGLFGDRLEVRTPLADFPTMLITHVESELQQGPAAFAGEAQRILQHLRAASPRLAELSLRPTLLHGDFKASNLHRTSTDQLLVLDWEFAYAGPALMDVGQLLRWSPSEEFLGAFLKSYNEHGELLPADWRACAALFDLGNLAGLLAKSIPGSRRAQDLIQRIERTIVGAD